MADLLIRHLNEKGQQHSSLAMLVNQWGFDQHLIPKALQNVGALIARDALIYSPTAGPKPPDLRTSAH